VDSLQPVHATPPDLRDEMCGSHRKRPAAEEADDETEAPSFMLSNLPPSAGKASALLKDKPDTAKAIVVFLGASKNAAENQFANARAKIQKLAKGKKSDPKAAPAAAAATTSTPAQPLQAAAAPPSGAFTPTSGQAERTVRRLPAATDVGGSALSFAPAAKAEPAPLTAVPDAKNASKAAKPAVAASAPASKKPDTSARTSDKTKAKATAKTTAKPAANTTAKPAANKPTATTNASSAASVKPAATKQAAAPKQAATSKQQ
jgi:D-alanyl-D-alanine carboxypeptidase